MQLKMKTVDFNFKDDDYEVEVVFPGGKILEEKEADEIEDKYEKLYDESYKYKKTAESKDKTIHDFITEKIHEKD